MNKQISETYKEEIDKFRDQEDMEEDDAKRFSFSSSSRPDFSFWDSSGPHSLF